MMWNSSQKIVNFYKMSYSISPTHVHLYKNVLFINIKCIVFLKRDVRGILFLFQRNSEKIEPQWC